MTLSYPVGPEDEGRKVYHILKNTLRLSAGEIKRLKSAGAVFVDGESVFMDRRVRSGERLEADLASFGNEIGWHVEDGGESCDSDIIISEVSEKVKEEKS